MSIEEDKEVEFYAAKVNAWLNTTLELDKSLLTLSAGGIGLLITLLTAVGISSLPILVLYIFALSSFVVTLFSVLYIFKGNANHLGQVISGNQQHDSLLAFFDNTARIGFLVGVLFSSAIGISIAVQSLQAEASMSKKEQGNPQALNESFNGIAKMQPVQSDLKKSFNGIADLKPSAAPAPAPKPAAPAAPVKRDGG